MTLVVDTSVVIKWIVAEDGSESALLLLDGEALTAPDLLRAEMANVLATKVRHKEMSSGQALASQTIVEAAIRFVPAMELSRRALELALELSHPAYDCFFLALAEVLDGTLITADQKMIKRCMRTPHRNRLRRFA